MKKLNVLQVFMLVFCAAMTVVSCSSDKDIDSQNQLNEFDVNKFDLSLSNAKSNIFIGLKNKSTQRVENGEPLFLSQTEFEQNVSEDEAEASLLVLLPESIQFLHEHDFSTEELIEEFGSLDNPEIVISADYIRNLEVSLSEEDPIKGNGNLIFGKADPDAFDCLIRAVGIDAVITLFNGKVTK